jgi:hypothetical protein
LGNTSTGIDYRCNNGKKVGELRGDISVGSTIGFLFVPCQSPQQHDRTKNQLTTGKDEKR